MVSKKKTLSDQQKSLIAQMHAAELLVEDFLALTWLEDEAHPARYARYERHRSALETAGHLLPHVVMHLFAKLEERALNEIGTYTALAQTVDPDGVARQHTNVPPDLLCNIHALHQHLPKVAHSKQAKNAASGPRPGSHHPDRQRVINELKKRIENDPNFPNARGQKASFIEAMLSNYPNIKRPNTIRDWMNEYLAENLGRLTP